MRKPGSGYLVGVLLAVVASSFAACSGDGDEPIQPGAGQGGEATGGDGITPRAGSTSGGEGGASAGSGGEGGDALRMIGDYRVRATFDDMQIGTIVTWPEQGRVAVTDNVHNVIQVFTVTDVSVEWTEAFKPQELRAGAAHISGLAKYGDGFVAVVANEAPPIQQYIVEVQGMDAPKTILTLAEGEQVAAFVADPQSAIAVQTWSRDGSKLQLAKKGSTTWKVLAEGSRQAPLALDGDRLLVGVSEALRGFDDGAGGAGGAGGASGAGGLDRSAHVRWLDLDGNQLQDFVAFGDATVAVKDDAGWLIGETNSFWGSYNAGIELLTDSGLKLLTKVPVISAGDGTDGAYDLIHHGNRVLVANCESGLLQSAFSASKLTLSPITGPWDLGAGECGPTAIEAVGDTIVIGGMAPLVFLQKP